MQIQSACFCTIPQDKKMFLTDYIVDFLVLLKMKAFSAHVLSTHFPVSQFLV